MMKPEIKLIIFSSRKRLILNLLSSLDFVYSVRIGNYHDRNIPNVVRNITIYLAELGSLFLLGVMHAFAS